MQSLGESIRQSPIVQSKNRHHSGSLQRWRQLPAVTVSPVFEASRNASSKLEAVQKQGGISRPAAEVGFLESLQESPEPPQPKPAAGLRGMNVISKLWGPKRAKATQRDALLSAQELLRDKINGDGQVCAPLSPKSLNPKLLNSKTLNRVPRSSIALCIDLTKAFAQSVEVLSKPDEGFCVHVE